MPSACNARTEKYLIKALLLVFMILPALPQRQLGYL